MTRAEAKEEIKRRISCADYLEKSKSGLYCCPYCDSGKGVHQTGAFKLYTETATWHCFQCKRSGDVLDLIQHALATDYNGALSAAAEMLGIEINRHSGHSSPTGAAQPAQREIIPPQQKTPPATAETPDLTAYYKTCAEELQKSPAALQYLSGRGIDAETAAAYNLGFDAAADPTGRGYKVPRVIVPINKGHYVARRIDGAEELKALNNTGATLGFFNETALYTGQRTVFVAEGWADAVAIEICGGSAIALNSANNTDKFLKHIKQHPTTATLIICTDIDQTGAAAAEELKTGLAQLGIKYTEARTLPGGAKDANELLQRDKTALQRFVKAAIMEAESMTEEREERTTEPAPAADPLNEFLQKIQTRAYEPYKTGLAFFDNLLGGGVIPQSVLMLMAAPGTGKTTLAQQAAEAMAANKKPVIYLNLEMSREQMYAKVFSSKTANTAHPKTAIEILQGYNLTREELQEITAIAAEYKAKQAPYIQYNPAEVGADLDRIIKYIRERGEQAKASGTAAPAIIVDYLHLITSKKITDVQELIKQAMTGFKRYAIDFNTFVLAIAATNRAANGGAISMDSARDSSNAEYGSDYILSLNYCDIDSGKIEKIENKVQAIADLQREPYRKMILRALKGRLTEPGRAATIYFDAAHNIFTDKRPEPAQSEPPQLNRFNTRHK